jgi:hypothetical protein
MTFKELTEAISGAKKHLLEYNEVVVRRIEKRGEKQTAGLDMLLEYNTPAMYTSIVDVIAADFKYVFNSVGIHIADVDDSQFTREYNGEYLGIPETGWGIFRISKTPDSRNFTVSIYTETKSAKKIACHYEPHELLEAYYARLKKMEQPKEEENEPAAEEL